MHKTFAYRDADIGTNWEDAENLPKITLRMTLNEKKIAKSYRRDNSGEHAVWFEDETGPKLIYKAMTRDSLHDRFEKKIEEILKIK